MKSIFRKAKTMIKLIKGKRWGYFLDRIPLYKNIISITNLLPHPDKYKYIVIGGHGVGMTALKYYLDKLGAKPMEILSYEIVRAFIFYRNFDGLILDKIPINKNIHKIMQKCNKKVPLYQLIRCPIETIKSNVNIQIFHTLSKVNTQQDANNVLFKVIYDIPHLMFYFRSTRELVNHIQNHVNYITMQDINDNNIYTTLKNFANNFKYDYNNIGGGNNESAIKGSVFPRCFPEFFKIGKTQFILSTLSRLNGESRKEIDMGSNIDEIRKSYSGNFYLIKDNIIVNGYEEYPLILASIDNQNNINDNNLAIQYINDYIKYIKSSIIKHNKFIFNEEKIINTLISNKSFAKELANKINYELFYIKKEAPNIFDSFKYTKQFLNICDVNF